MKIWNLIWVVVISIGCAHVERSAVPPTRPHECAGTNVRSAAELRALAGCTHVSGDLRISVPGVSDLRALRSLWSVEGMLALCGNPDLESLAGLERLHHVGNLAIVDNPSLARLRGLSSLRSARGLTVMHNPRLHDLRGLEGLQTLDGLVLVHNGLFRLHGLDGLRSVGDLVIANNRRLIDVSALSELETTGSLSVHDNPAIARDLGWIGSSRRPAAAAHAPLGKLAAESPR